MHIIFLHIFSENPLTKSKIKWVLLLVAYSQGATKNTNQRHKLSPAYDRCWWEKVKTYVLLLVCQHYQYNNNFVVYLWERFKWIFFLWQELATSQFYAFFLGNMRLWKIAYTVLANIFYSNVTFLLRKRFPGH